MTTQTGGNRNTIIIVVVVVVLLCCCCIAAVGGYYLYVNGDQLFGAGAHHARPAEDAGLRRSALPASCAPRHPPHG